MILAIGCDDDDGTGPEPVRGNRVWVDRISASTDAEVVLVKVRFSNLDSLLLVEVPLQVSGTGFLIDSVSFVGSRVADAFIREGIVKNADRTIGLYIADTVYIHPGDGVLASLFFTLYDDSRGQLLVIDTVTIVDVGESSLRYMDLNDSIFTPEFVPGEISVLY
jgi:hypothetical protein